MEKKLNVCPVLAFVINYDMERRTNAIATIVAQTEKSQILFLDLPTNIYTHMPTHNHNWGP